jgi:uracil-DNA glycosylase family 4
MSLIEDIQNCSKCPLRSKLNEFEKPNIGVGSNKPKVMIIIDNNVSESIFLIDGIKLEYLEKNIKLYNINKSNLYITPMIKCARKPTVKSMNACLNWISEEMKVLKPEHIIMLSSNFDVSYCTTFPKPIEWYDVSLAKLASSTAMDTKYTDTIFRKIKQYCD